MILDKKQTSAMELLAPAGSFAAFQAAMEEGADAIYVGAPKLNARALSRDFSYPEINALVREAHSSGVKVYIAMNSLVKEDEIRTAVEGLAMFEKIRPNGLIIQDLGLLWLAQKYFPELPLHASTLMLVHNSLAVQKMIELGFKRIVLPRELTLEEIKDISAKTSAELEVFVHGAMCFSYSGLCMFSSMFGGKSSLRGQCVQPCRRLYGWQRKKGFVKHGKRSEKDGGYLFSMHDLSGIDLLPQLQEAGVSCLKIEGRLKSAEYVRKTVRAYRLILDDMSENGSNHTRKKEAQRYLDEAMGRRRSTGFFLSSSPQEAVTPALSGNIGIPAGKILKFEETKGKGGERHVILTVDLKLDIQIGDRLRLHDERSGERTAFNLRILTKGNRSVKKASLGQKVQIVLKGKVLKHRKASFKGSLFKVDIGYGKSDEKVVKSSILKRKQKELRINENKIETVLKEFAVRGTKNDRKVQLRKGSRLPIWVMVQSLRDRQYRLPISPEKYIVPLNDENIDLLRSAPAKLRRQDKDLIWGLPPIILEDRLAWYRRTLDSLVEDDFGGFQLGHVAQVGLFDKYVSAGKDLKLYAHYSCNILNSAALKFLSTLNFSNIQFSLETDAENLETAMSHFQGDVRGSARVEKKTAVGIYAFGHPALFTARLDDSRYNYGKRFVSPKGEVFVLDRFDGLTRTSSVSPFSLLDVRQELALYGIDYLVIDLTGGNIKRNLSEFDTLVKGRRKDSLVMSGNFKTGLL